MPFVPCYHKGLTKEELRNEQRRDLECSLDLGVDGEMLKFLSLDGNLNRRTG
jgi:hypothetical protein